MWQNTGLILGRRVWWCDALLNKYLISLDPASLKGFPSDLSHTRLGSRRQKRKVTIALTSMVNAKEVRPDELSVELLKLQLKHDPTVLWEFLRVVQLV